jgi:hypothetical protein
MERDGYIQELLLGPQTAAIIPPTSFPIEHAMLKALLSTFLCAQPQRDREREKEGGR